MLDPQQGPTLHRAAGSSMVAVVAPQQSANQLPAMTLMRLCVAFLGHAI